MSPTITRIFQPRTAAPLQGKPAQATADASGAEQPITDIHVRSTGATQTGSKVATDATDIRRWAMSIGMGTCGLLSGALTGWHGGACAMIAIMGAGLALGAATKIHGKVSAFGTGALGLLALTHGVANSGATATALATVLGLVGGAYLSDQISDGRLQAHLKNIVSLSFGKKDQA